MQMRRPGKSIGDVCEVPTPVGIAYIQYTRNGGDMGELVRIVPGLFSERPDIAALMRQRELYFVFFTLEYALKEKDKFSIVSNQPVPDFAKPLPMMRKQGHIDRAGNTLFWYIGEARKMSTLAELQRAPRITRLTAEEEKLSIGELWPPPVMIDKLASGRLPELAEEYRLKARAKRDAERPRKVEARQSAGPIEHYFYFSRETQAYEAAKLIMNEGLQASKSALCQWPQTRRFHGT
jgi:hypothetical protein